MIQKNDQGFNDPKIRSGLVIGSILDADMEEVQSQSLMESRDRFKWLAYIDPPPFILVYLYVACNTFAFTCLL